MSRFYVVALAPVIDAATWQKAVEIHARKDGLNGPVLVVPVESAVRAQVRTEQKLVVTVTEQEPA